MRTVSYETAKKLKEAGWDKEADFYWCEDKDRDSPISTKLFDKDTANARKYNSPELNIFPAPTLDELLEEMPTMELRKIPEGYYTRIRYNPEIEAMNENPVEAIALLWLTFIYLEEEEDDNP